MLRADRTQDACDAVGERVTKKIRSYASEESNKWIYQNPSSW